MYTTPGTACLLPRVERQTDNVRKKLMQYEYHKASATKQTWLPSASSSCDAGCKASASLPIMLQIIAVLMFASSTAHTISLYAAAASTALVERHEAARPRACFSVLPMNFRWQTQETSNRLRSACFEALFVVRRRIRLSTTLWCRTIGRQYACLQQPSSYCLLPLVFLIHSSRHV